MQSSTLKKIEIALVTVCALIVSGIVLLFVVAFTAFASYDDFRIKSWESAQGSPCVGQVFKRLLETETESVSLNDVLEEGAYEQALAIYDNRIYLVWRHWAQGQETYLLISSDLSKEDSRVLYMTDADVFEKACANKERIWWTENDEIVQYDFKSGNIKRTNDTTETDKSGLIEDGLVQIDHEDNALLLLDEKSGHRIRITFEEFAEMSDKTDELMQISKQKTWSRKPCTEYFFNRIYCFDDVYYVVGQIRNKGGDAIALVFRFDSEARKAEYVTYDNVGEGTWTGYELIPRFEANESPHQLEFQRDGGENVQK